MAELKRAKKASKEEVDSFLKGSNPQEHIIKIECGYNDSMATVIWRDDNFEKHYDKEPFYPFCWAKAAAGRSMFKGNRTQLILAMQSYGIGCKGLIMANEEGIVPERMANGYNVMFYAQRPMSNQTFSKFFDDANVPLKPKEKHWSYGKNYYKTCAPNEQFMIQTGKRLFKGYESYDDILRMQWDIETTGLDKKNDLIDQIGIRTNKGFTKLIQVKGDTREEKILNGRLAINEAFDLISQIDPDVVVGYNSEGFDWEFFNIFLKEHFNVDMVNESKREFIQNGVYKKKQQAVLKLGGEMEYYYPTSMWGKHIADCLFSVRRAQALDSNMKKATLKYVTKYSKINKNNRVYVPGNIINDTWADKTLSYAFNDDNGKWFKVDDKVLSKRFILREECGSHIEREIVEDTLIYENESEAIANICLEEIKPGATFIGSDEQTCTILSCGYDNTQYGTYYEINYSYTEENNIIDYIENDGGLKYTKIDNKLIDNENNEVYEFVSGEYIVNRYLEDDLWETDKVELRYNESNFLVGKMLPVNFERMCTMGTATIWKYIMMAWSYEHDLAIPLETNARSFTGGLSRLLTVGYMPNVQKLDYNSMYPSGILTFGIKTPIDISDAMSAMLEYILTQREYYKELKGKYGKEAKKIGASVDEYISSIRNSQEYINLSDKEFGEIIGKDSHVIELRQKQKECSALSTRNDKMQLPLKITANAFFGSFGAGGGIFPWSDIDCAEETTCCGRQELRLMLKWFTDLGYQGIVCDTDGMNFKQPPSFRYTEENPYVSTGMNRNTEKGKTYVGPWGDLAEFNDLFMRGKNGLDIDEFVPSSCYLARKNYMDLLDVDKQEVKLVGNTIKSKKMPIYIEKFVDDIVRDLLNDRGKEYLEKYYDKIDEIYNLRIPLKDIASVGKIKMSLDDYKANCNMRTKSGSKKSRQAWYELAIKHNLDVHMGDTIYFINTGSKASDSDVQRITHYYENRNGVKTDVTKEYEKEFEKLKKNIKLGDKTAIDKLFLSVENNKNKYMNLETYIKTYHTNAYDEDEVIFNCILLPNSIVDDEENHYCEDEGIEYNVSKYITTFNNRIKPHLVCFDKSIRVHQVRNKKNEIVEENNIIITNPKDRKVFLEKDCKLVSGQPYKESDQDTYEQLMTMEDKEIRFWISVDKTPVYIDECGMNWESIKSEYLERMEILKHGGIREEVEAYNNIIAKTTQSDIDKLIEEGTLPDGILKICDFDAKTGHLISKKWEVQIGTIYDILDYQYNIQLDDDDTDVAPMSQYVGEL